MILTVARQLTTSGGVLSDIAREPGDQGAAAIIILDIVLQSILRHAF